MPATIKRLNQAAPPAPAPDLPKAYLVDSSIYVFRGWHIMPYDLEDNDGNPVNAVHGFADFLIQLLSERRPAHLACAFDQSLGLDWRREIYPDYKANRDPAPEELKRQFSYCRELVQLMGIAWFASDRFEADDIIGTLSGALHQQGFSSVIITADKDLTQLVNQHDVWWDFARHKQLDYRGVEKTWGVKPEQIADLLALTGDKVDNIPGVPGIGPKTAANLLKKHNSIEQLGDNLDAVAEMKFRGAIRIRNLLKMHWDKVLLAKQLTIIKADPDIPLQSDAITIKPASLSMLQEFMDFIQLPAYKQQQLLSALENLTPQN